MNSNSILENAINTGSNISIFHVALIIGITIIGAVLLTTGCGGIIYALKKLWNKIFHN